MSSRYLWLIFSATSAISLCTASLPALAQELRLDTIVVSPNRAPTKVSETGSSVTVIDEQTIEEQSQPLVLDYLATVPGVSLATPGGAGTETSLSLRGAPRRYVKTLYNGIDLADITAPQVQTSYQYLLTGGITSMEVLRGSQSTLYGSDAIAGVISVDTLGDIRPGITHIIGAEGGSFGTASGIYGLRAANDAGKFAANIVGFHTDGISAAAAGTERDGYQNLTGDFNGEYRFNDVFSVFASGFIIDAEAEFDQDSPKPPIDDPTSENLNKTRHVAGRVGFNMDFMDGRLKNTFSVQGMKFDRRLHSVHTTLGEYDARYEGGRTKFDYQGSFEATDWLTLRYGADHERQNAVFSDDSGSLPTDDRMHDTGIWLQGDLQPIENLFLSAGLRRDEHNRYGDETTYRLSGTYLFDQTGTRLHSSYGTGFRAPSLYELYAPFAGDPTLRPETSKSFDIGVEQEFLDGALVADLTYFNLQIENLIIYNNATWGYEQIDGRSRMSGVEASVSYDVNDQLKLGGSYTYTDAVDQYDVRLPQVARHMVGLTATYKPAEKWTVSGTGRIALDTTAIDGSELDDYFLLNAKVAYKPDEDKELYLRVENLLDQDYQTVRGFNNPGIGVFAGFKMAFQP
ncbi:TonB-dependent receptor plug domain-containing protein [Nitratireductor aestuarii]|nr:TonB-dependent receptor [Nitratireductor aestuarii]